MEGIIYTLSDPRTDEVRYVGQTAEAPETRLRKHLWPSTLRREHCHRTNWIKALAMDGVQPKIEVVEVSQDVDEAERFYISYFRSLGFRLVNQQDGGDGWTGGKKRGPMSAEHRAKIGAGVRKASPNRNTEAVRKHCFKNLAAINSRRAARENLKEME